MRFIPLQSVKEDAILHRQVYSEEGQILLQKGMKLTKQYINRLKEMNINGVYIDCNLSKNIEIVSIIDDQLRNRAVQDVRKLFTFVENNEKISQIKKTQQIKSVSNAIDLIVDQILDHEHTMLNLVDLKIFDNYTFHHCVNVAVISITIGAALDMSKEQLYKLGLAGILHDIGKTFVPEEILNKEGKLDEEEWGIMKEHPFLGFKHIKENYPSLPATSLAGILNHHEKWNGTGYPSGKKGEEIFEFGRIIAIADVYDALTSDRPYRKGLLPHTAVEYIMGMAEDNFDLSMVKTFLKNIAPYPLGTILKLSNGHKGIVIKNTPNFGLRPILSIIKDENNHLIPENKRMILDLKVENNITIESVVDY
jgi:HD-GYP domain-containing protein (c-di-GMP phosphodiesterase class II)